MIIGAPAVPSCRVLYTILLYAVVYCCLLPKPLLLLLLLLYMSCAAVIQTRTPHTSYVHNAMYDVRV